MDKRVMKTKKQIYEGLLNMLEEKSFEEIKISEVCKIANINRSTFYSHFKDKYDLFDSLMKDSQAKLMTELEKQKEFTNLKSYYMEIIKILLNHIEEEKEVYKTIMIHNRYSIVLDMIQNTILDHLSKKMAEEIKGRKTKIPPDFTAAFYLGGIVNIGMGWILNPKNITQEEIYQYINLLVPDEIK